MESIDFWPFTKNQDKKKESLFVEEVSPGEFKVSVKV